MKLRLLPPRVEVSPELLWVLTRAFAPLLPWKGSHVEPAAAWRLAEAFDLSCRIGWRVPPGQLFAELGEEIAARFAERYHAAAASALLINAVTSEVMERIIQTGLPVVLLKSNALVLSGLTAVGARRFTDLDLLVPAGRAREVSSLLSGQGYRGSRHRDGAHQLSSLFHPTGVMVEIHTRVKHMRLGRGEGWVRLEDLESKGLLRALAGLAGGWIPSLEFLAGHALVHGVVQHWRQVGDYPLMRLLADLQDIEAKWEGSVPLEQAVVPWLAAEEAEVEGQAVMDLLRQLGAGAHGSGEEPSGKLGENVFLRHVAALRYDRAYQDAVRAAAALWVDTNRSRAVALARKVRNRLFLLPASVDRRYGARPTRFRRVLVHLWRPLDLLGKLFWLLARYARYRWRSLDRRSIRIAQEEAGRRAAERWQ